ncbi:unnamed protein product [Effrenium voratum]|nr:unnamed protein product [Effrenium voratum]
MARIARRCLRVKDLPLFSLQHSFRELAEYSGELALNLFEPRYVELARRIAPPGPSQFGYAQVLQHKAGGRGMLVGASNFNWHDPKEGPVVLTARGLQRFRILSVQSEEVEGGDPLYLAHVQLLSDRDLSRMCRLRKRPGAADMVGQVYIQDGGGLGSASYHFEPQGSYISYESALSTAFSPLDDGSQPPATKAFENTSFDKDTQTFRGTINWAPRSWRGDQRWEYEMVFSADYESIVGGGVTAVPADPGGTTKFLRFGVNLHYNRLQLSLDTAEAVTDVLLQSGVRASEMEASAGAYLEPVRARMSHRRAVRRALKRATAGRHIDRLMAVQRLRRLAAPPKPVAQAENALHVALLTAAERGEGEVQMAIEEALRVCWEDSGNAKVNAEMAQGVQLLQDHKVEEAAEAFTRVLDQAPNFAEAWHKRSMAFYAQKKFREAVEDCVKALDIRPLHYWCLTGMGSCHYELGETDKAKECWKAALRICPTMPGARNKLDEAEVRELVDEHVRPRMVRLVTAFSDSEPQIQPLGSSHWDVHRIRMDETNYPGVWAYFFRLSIRRPESTEGPVKSRARFYLLKGTDGKVFPFLRSTIGDSSFSLEPGEEYKFCWCLVVGREIQRAMAGLLLEGSADGQPEYHNEELPMLFPTGSPEIDLADAAVLGDGYTFTGHLDLRTLADF